MNLRDKILNAKDILEEVVEIKEWDVSVMVKGMTGKERASMLKDSMDKDGNTDLHSIFPKLVITCAHDPETGAKIFTNADKDMLNSKSASAVEKIAKKALEMSGLGEDAQEKAKKS
jgi:hypothetical protein